TGPVPFWEALEQFCKAADLHEWDGLTLIPGMPSVSQSQPAMIGGGLQIQGQIVIRGGPTRPAMSPGEIVLLEGPALPVSSVRAGAVRIRCLPPSTPFPAETASGDDVLFPLQVSAEPKLQ